MAEWARRRRRWLAAAAIAVVAALDVVAGIHFLRRLVVALDRRAAVRR